MPFLSRQELSAANLASSIGLTVPARATKVILNASIAPVRFRRDGGVPTATVGERLVNGVVSTEVHGHADISNLRFILESGSPTVEASFFGSDAT